MSFLNPKAVYSGGKRLGFGKTSSQQYCNMKEYKTQFPQDSIQQDKQSVQNICKCMEELPMYLVLVQTCICNFDIKERDFIFLC